jgi:hypothetical protein
MTAVSANVPIYVHILAEPEVKVHFIMIEVSALGVLVEVVKGVYTMAE